MKKGKVAKFVACGAALVGISTAVFFVGKSAGYEEARSLYRSVAAGLIDNNLGEELLLQQSSTSSGNGKVSKRSAKLIASRDGSVVRCVLEGDNNTFVAFGSPAAKEAFERAAEAFMAGQSIKVASRDAKKYGTTATLPSANSF